MFARCKLLFVFVNLVVFDSTWGHGLRFNQKHGAVNQGQQLQVERQTGQLEDDFFPEQDGPELCMTWTGGTCGVLPCKEERGPTVCTSKRCECNPGFCATAEGKCVRQRTGTWLRETYAIRFSHPYQTDEPYLGIFACSDDCVLGERNYSDDRTVLGYLASTADNTPQWMVAFTPNGNVRLQNTMISQPNMLIIYDANRKGMKDNFLQHRPRYEQEIQLDENVTTASGQFVKRRVAAHDSAGLARGTISKRSRAGRIFNQTAFNESELAKLSNSLNVKESHHSLRVNVNMEHNNALVPMVVRLAETKPLEAVFRIHPTIRDGPALEIWDPSALVSIASANKEWWFSDTAAQHGICECSSPVTIFGDDDDEDRKGHCAGRQKVAFEPALPAEVVISGPRNIVTPIGKFAWWQTALAGLFVVCCVFLIEYCGGFSSCAPSQRYR